MKTYRAWINQPSTQQPLHKFHGEVCIVNDTEEDSCVTVWFIIGPIHSMVIPRNCVTPILCYNLL